MSTAYAPAYRTPPGLARQNTGTGWIDCNARDLPHRWTLLHIVRGSAYWSCARSTCAVDTRTREAVRPRPYLGGLS